MSKILVSLELFKTKINITKHCIFGRKVLSITHSVLFHAEEMCLSITVGGINWQRQWILEKTFYYRSIISQLKNMTYDETTVPEAFKLIDWFIIWLFNTSISTALVTMYKIIGEDDQVWWICKNYEGSSHDLLEGIISESALTDWGKPQKISLRIADSPVKTWNGHLPNASVDHYFTTICSVC